jgi:hypothetical protein
MIRIAPAAKLDFIIGTPLLTIVLILGLGLP